MSRPSRRRSIPRRRLCSRWSGPSRRPSWSRSPSPSSSRSPSRSPSPSSSRSRSRNRRRPRSITCRRLTVQHRRVSRRRGRRPTSRRTAHDATADRAPSRRSRPRDRLLAGWGCADRSGPKLMPAVAARGARRRAPPGAAAHPHPSRPRRCERLARGAVARPRGVRPRARRAAHDRSRAPAGERAASVRRGHGPAVG